MGTDEIAWCFQARAKLPKKRRKVLPVEQLRQVRPPGLPAGSAAPLAGGGGPGGPAPPGAQNRRMNAIKLNPAPKTGTFCFAWLTHHSLFYHTPPQGFKMPYLLGIYFLKRSGTLWSDLSHATWLTLRYTFVCADFCCLSIQSHVGTHGEILKTTSPI